MLITAVIIVTVVTVVVAVTTIGDAPVVAIRETAIVVDDLVGAVHLVGADIEMNAVDLAVPAMPGLDRGLALGHHLVRALGRALIHAPGLRPGLYLDIGLVASRMLSRRRKITRYFKSKRTTC